MRLELPEDDQEQSEAVGDEMLELPADSAVDGGLESAELENLLLSAADSEGIEELQEPVLDFSDQDLDFGEEKLESLQLEAESEPVAEAETADEALADHPDAVSLEQYKQEMSNDMPADIDLDADEVNTKLDLARAYVDMGDAEGARSLLEEVLNEGNNVQSGEAQKILAELA